MKYYVHLSEHLLTLQNFNYYLKMHFKGGTLLTDWKNINQNEAKLSGKKKPLVSKTILSQFYTSASL